jgi:flagellar motility protein MotE (MotC chaperone)
MSYRLEELTDIINNLRTKLRDEQCDDRNSLENELKNRLQELTNLNESLYSKSKLLKG